MFSVITIKQLENTLVLFKKDKITEKNIYINGKEFKVERKEECFKISNNEKTFEVSVDAGKIRNYKIFKGNDTVREIFPVIGRFVENKQVWEIEEMEKGIPKSNFKLTLNEEATEDLIKILGI